MDTTMSKSSKAFLLHASRKRSHSHDVGCSSDACISSDGTPPFDNNSFPLGFLSVHARLVQRRPSVQAAALCRVLLPLSKSIRCRTSMIAFVQVSICHLHVLFDDICLFNLLSYRSSIVHLLLDDAGSVRCWLPTVTFPPISSTHLPVVCTLAYYGSLMACAGTFLHPFSSSWNIGSKKNKIPD
ncbi:hypothetical protein OsI_15637 [Oryza sativa Indica Group]|uniref:Uncharacterized protein n=1 Tax=Oryza sativa subsp. indica TaxID=39946 RepID=B8AT66_ORYSI|nr:hypothetical protein OsI_15637 [Oryza sativa Indica Group]